MINSILNPINNIRLSCSKVMLQAKHVTIEMKEIKNYVHQINESIQWKENIQQITWDANNWHYCHDIHIPVDSKTRGLRTCQYIFVLDSLNFCFWEAKEYFEYDTLAISLKKVLESNENVFDPISLINISQEEIQSWFGDNIIPNIEARQIALQELGQVLIDQFNGNILELIHQANHSAVQLVYLIIQSLPSFRDTAIYKGRRIDFYKRAQILVGDLWAAFGKSTNINDYISFYDIDQLTMFADYRVPQILRQLGILEYSEELANLIDNHQILSFGSEYEIEIRAATIIAVEMIHQRLKENNIHILIIELDWLLWQQGEELNNRKELLPHHRVQTIYY